MMYELVTWPESQLFMEEPWFENEAILALGSEEKTGSSAYFIPIDKVLKNTPDSLLIRVFNLFRSGKFVIEEETVEDKKNYNQLKKDIKDYLL